MQTVHSIVVLVFSCLVFAGVTLNMTIPGKLNKVGIEPVTISLLVQCSSNTGLLCMARVMM